MRLIVLYGPPAAGKYTVAKAVSDETGYKLLHNHLTVDLLLSVLEFGSPEFFRLSQDFKLAILEQAAKENVPGVIVTFVYEKPTDDGFVREFVDRIASFGAEAVFIQVHCETEELLKRVSEPSRAQFRKVKSEKGLLNTLARGDLLSPIDFVDSVKIDNTDLTVDETVSRVLKVIDEG